MDVMAHCCACADKEDVREISAQVLGVAAQVLADSSVDAQEARIAANELLVAAFKAEKRKHDAMSLPRL